MITLTVNGSEQHFDGNPDMPLLWYLRDVLGHTGTKFGCGMALCGACTVHLDGVAIRSCITPVAAASGKRVTTIEALSTDLTHPLQQAWQELNVAQCGYCQSGQIMQAASVLKTMPHPSAADIEDAMARNICGGGTCTRIRAAIRMAERRGGAG